MKRKPEVLLSDVFKHVKAAYLLKSLEQSLSPKDKAIMDIYQRDKFKIKELDHRFWYKTGSKHSNGKELSSYISNEIYIGILLKWAKPFVKINHKELAKLIDSYNAIKFFRKNQKYVQPNSIQLHFYGSHNKKRIFPLPEYKYHNIANKIYLKMGCPKRKFKIISDVKMGKPEIKTNGQYGYHRVIHSRTVGVQIFKTNGKYIFGIKILH